MDKKAWVVVLVISGVISYYFPQWNGFIFGPTLDITSGDGRIVGLILFVGALLLWYMPSKEN